MGIPAKEYPPGDNCMLCFGAGETPDRLLLSIAGIQTGEYWHDGLASPPNGTWTLYQNQFDPCYWNNGPDNPWVMWAKFEVDNSHTGGFFELPGQRFFGQVWEQCIRHFTNSHIFWANNFYYGGYLTLLTPTEIVALVNTVMPVEKSDAKFEVVPGPDNIIVIRYASRKQRTNIELKFDLS